MAPSTKVFDIPELTTLIANDLSQHNLAQCCRVSRHWFESFTPHLWHSISFQRFDPIPKFQSPEGRAGLIRNGHHIRAIATLNLNALEPFLEYGENCTKLVCLDAERDVSRDDESNQGRSFGVMASTRLGKFRARQCGQKQITRNPNQFPFNEGHISVRRAKATNVLLSILQRNPQLQFLILPAFCFKSEAIVKTISESLLMLKELYSPSQTWQWGIYKQYSLRSLPSASTMVSNSSRTKPEVFNGSILSTMLFSPTPLLRKYPRLAELERDKFAKVNFETLLSIQETSEHLPFLVVHSGDADAINQILRAATALKEITLLLEDEVEGMYDIVNIELEAFLKHAPTLEHFDVSGYDFDKNIFNAILRASPNLKTVRTIEENLDIPRLEVRLDAVEDFHSCWACGDSLEVFECLIAGVPRPDIIGTQVDIDIGDIGDNVNDLASQHPHLDGESEETPSPAQQESYTIQRQVLSQLGRLTCLQTLRLGKPGRDEDEPEFSFMSLKGIRTMVVDEYVQRDCLELSLASGLGELAGLKELEVLDVTQMAHRIGLEEIQWMVEHWPKLKRIDGLWYTNYDSVIDGSVNSKAAWLEREQPEHLCWLYKNRPSVYSASRPGINHEKDY
ncbi:hypothetical protein EC991_001477 [Linnemannia zychae]|nr:hypothetical protein EC991_001477 [Linnemannia zychae]